VLARVPSGLSVFSSMVKSLESVTSIWLLSVNVMVTLLAGEVTILSPTLILVP